MAAARAWASCSAEAPRRSHRARDLRAERPPWDRWFDRHLRRCSPTFAPGTRVVVRLVPRACPYGSTSGVVYNGDERVTTIVIPLDAHSAGFTSSFAPVPPPCRITYGLPGLPDPIQHCNGDAKAGSPNRSSSDLPIAAIVGVGSAVPSADWYAVSGISLPRHTGTDCSRISIHRSRHVSSCR